MCITPVSPATTARAPASAAAVSCSENRPAALRARAPAARAMASPAAHVLRTTHHEQFAPSCREVAGQLAPVLHRPALGEVRRARRQHHERRIRQPVLGQPLPGALPRGRRQVQLGRVAVGLHVEAARRLEEPLGLRHRVEVEVALEPDERGPRHAPLAVAAPAAGHHQPECAGAQHAVQVEQVREPPRAEPAGQGAQGLVLRVEHDQVVERRMIGHERGERRPGAVGDVRVRMAAAQHAEQGGREDHVAHAAQAEEEDAGWGAGHGGKVGRGKRREKRRHPRHCEERAQRATRQSRCIGTGPCADIAMGSLLDSRDGRVGPCGASSQ